MLKFALSILFSSILASYAFADSQSGVTVNLKIFSKPNLVEGKGIVLSSKDVYETNEIKITKLDDKLHQISFYVPGEYLKDDAVATAMATDEGGNLVFADVTPGLALDAKAALSLLDIKPCAPDSGTSITSTAAIGPLRQLVDIRSARTELAKIKLSKVVDENLLAKLRKFEEAFGYQYESEITADMNPSELVERLSKLSFSLAEYKVSRAR